MRKQDSTKDFATLQELTLGSPADLRRLYSSMSSPRYLRLGFLLTPTTKPGSSEPNTCVFLMIWKFLKRGWGREVYSCTVDSGTRSHLQPQNRYRSPVGKGMDGTTEKI